MSPRELIPTVGYDARTVNGAAGPLERFAALSCEVLLLARRVVLRGTGHTAPDNSGQPGRVAAGLHRFFSG